MADQEHGAAVFGQQLLEQLEGVDVEVLHRATLGQGPIACRIGRMTVALRRAVAGAIHVSLTPAAAE